MRVVLFCGLMIAAMFTIYGQEDTSQSSFIDNIILRKSFMSKNDKAEPAIITYTNPKNGKESWLLNAAIGVNVWKKDAVITLSPYFEYDRNTLIDKEQDNWQTGLSLEWQTQDYFQEDKSWSPVLIVSVKYNEDRIKEITSFQGNLYFTPIFPGKDKDPAYFWRPNTIVDFGKVVQFVYTPYVGLENENRISTEEATSEGNIYRAYVRITANLGLFPANLNLRGKFEFNLDWQYRYNFSESVDDLSANDHSYFTTSFNYIPFSDDKGRSVKIGVDYTNGDNPTTNFEQQSFYAVSLKLKL